MTVGTAPSVIDRIRAATATMFAPRGIAAPTDPRSDLRAAGLTSLDMVNLMLAVEAEFDLFVPQEQITTANFANEAAIEKLVRSLAPT